MQERWTPSLSQEDPLEKGMATHSSILAGNPKDRGVWWATVHAATQNRHDLATKQQRHVLGTCGPGSLGAGRGGLSLRGLRSTGRCPRGPQSLRAEKVSRTRLHRPCDHRLHTLPTRPDPATETRSTQAARMQLGGGEDTGTGPDVCQTETVQLLFSPQPAE